MNQIKKIVKKTPFLSKIRNEFILLKEYYYDYRIFKSNYMFSKKNINKVEYNILLNVHGIEKGLSNKNIRFFGENKVKQLIEDLEYCSKNKDSFAYIMGISALHTYKKICENNNWTDKEIYKIVCEFILKSDFKDEKRIGTEIYNKKALLKGTKFDYFSFVSSRHSVRNYSESKIKNDDINKAIEIAIKTPTACNRQMIKVYNVENLELKKFIFKIGQGFSGFELDNASLFIITYDISANYFSGERNQGMFNAGLFSMNFVNGLHSLGIGSCFVQFGNSSKDEKKIKAMCHIPVNERIAVFIAAGYYSENSIIPLSSRKSLFDIYKKIN